VRVRGWLGACGLLAPASCKKNEPIDEAKAGGKTIANFLRITTDIFKFRRGNHGSQRLESLERRQSTFLESHRAGCYGLIDPLKKLDNRAVSASRFWTP